MISLRGGIALVSSFALVVAIGMCNAPADYRPLLTPTEVKEVSAWVSTEVTALNRIADRAVAPGGIDARFLPPRVTATGRDRFGNAYLLLEPTTTRTPTVKGLRQAVVRRITGEPLLGCRELDVIHREPLVDGWWYVEMEPLPPGAPRP